MSQKFSNNGRSRLVGSLNNSATTFTVESATADTFPVANTVDWLSPLDWFKATLENSLGQVEIIRVGTRSLGSGIFGNVLRGQDGTTAIAFDAGTTIGLRVTAQDIEAALAFQEQNGNYSGNNTFSGDNIFSGQNNFTGQMRQNGVQVRTLPVGSIVMWSGNIASIPAGWQLCNGSGGTPDLRDRFVIGAAVDVTGESRSNITGAPTKTGGSKDAIAVTHTHNLNINSGSQSAQHTHTATTNPAGAHAHSITYGSAANTSDVFPSRLSNGGISAVDTGAVGNHQHSLTTNGEGQNHTHNVAGATDAAGAAGTNANLVPYFAVAYIMCMAYA